MSQNVPPPILDVKQAGKSSMQLAGQDLLLNYRRLLTETKGLGAQNVLTWSSHFELQPDQTGKPQVLLHLTVGVNLPLTCQRCLGAVDVPVQVDRRFRFVDTEAQAELEDDESPEDILVSSRDFDLPALIEDEVLMDLPVVPRHDTCPVAIKLVASDADFEDAPVKPNPFAVLAGLKESGRT
jgi:uncharacterized protein